FAASQDWNLHGREKIAADRQNAGGFGLRAGDANTRSAGPVSNQRHIRQSCALHTGDSGESGVQVFIERENLRVFVSRLPGIELERQQVLLIESELNRLKIRKRSNEEARSPPEST